MSLNLYRRHRPDCEGSYPQESRSGQFEERRKGWKKCNCVIFCSGVLGGVFKRRQTGKSNWEEAAAVVETWESTGSWEASVPAPVAVPASSVSDAASKVTIDRAIEYFLAEHIASYNTHKKYRLLLKKIKAHSESKGYVLIEQWSPLDVREFRSSWGVSPLTASKYMTIVKSFFEFAVSNEWIIRNPARLVKEVRGQVRPKERIPFTDEELVRMYEACETKYGKLPIRSPRAEDQSAVEFSKRIDFRYRWKGEDLADFISVSVYTGFRISDVCTFHVDRVLRTGECHIRTTKNGKKVYTWIPDWLQQRIRARAAKYGPLIFGEHTTEDTNVVTEVWRRKLKRLWSLCGPWPETPTPHRFRHTFARILLQQPTVTIRDVAELLGNTEDMVRRHYAAWVPERQARLTKVLQNAFVNTPRPGS